MTPVTFTFIAGTCFFKEIKFALCHVYYDVTLIGVGYITPIKTGEQGKKNIQNTTKERNKH